jgi:uncharacterized protein
MIVSGMHRAAWLALKWASHEKEQKRVRMTAEGTIDYEALAQDAMRGVVRSVLENTAKSGLPGEHHFYISFDTLANGVVLSKRLREKYPGEMTIVLQHRFWDLLVNDDRFEVKLTFDGIPERLVIPFRAIRVFFDPSVRYGLQFESPEVVADLAPATSGLARPSHPSPGLVSAVPLAADKPDAPDASRSQDGAKVASNTDDVADRDEDASAASATEEAAAASAQIVSLDAFRKK